MKRISRHPFAVKAHFDESLVLAYAAPAEQLRALVPACLSLDCYQERSAFIAVAMVQTSQLRPACFPKFFGRSFLLAGYRIFVRYHGRDGRERRGLYIIKSQTNKRSMIRLGNLFTKYRYEHQEIHWTETNGLKEIRSSAGLQIQARAGDSGTPLPPSSVFPDWRAARRFAGPMPFTFSYDKSDHTMTTVEGVRKEWKPSPVSVELAKIPFLDDLNIPGLQLANAFTIRNVPYLWKKGTTEQCPAP